MGRPQNNVSRHEFTEVQQDLLGQYQNMVAALLGALRMLRAQARDLVKAADIETDAQEGVESDGATPSISYFLNVSTGTDHLQYSERDLDTLLDLCASYLALPLSAKVDEPEWLEGIINTKAFQNSPFAPKSNSNSPLQYVPTRDQLKCLEKLENACKTSDFAQIEAAHDQYFKKPYRPAPQMQALSSSQGMLQRIFNYFRDIIIRMTGGSKPISQSTATVWGSCSEQSLAQAGKNLGFTKTIH